MFSCDLITIGLKEESSQISNAFNYLSILENHIQGRLQLEENLYESLKNRSGTYKYLKRINFFEQFKIAKSNSLKHPEIISYYYSKDSICSTEYNKISLPDMQVVSRKAGEVSINLQKSSNGTSRDPVRNITSDLTSHQYVVKSGDRGTKYLEYIIDYKRKITLNKFSIVDASIFETTISEVYYYNDNKQKQTISYSLIRNLHKKLLVFDSNVSSRRFYIRFSQINYIDLETENQTIVEQLKQGSNNSFDTTKDENYYYYYEFNIDRIEGSYSLKKKSGIFKLKEEVDLKDLNILEIDIKGVNLENVELLLFLKKIKNSQEIISKFDENNKINIGNYDSGEIIVIINGKENKSYENFYIDSIDIKGS